MTEPEPDSRRRPFYAISRVEAYTDAVFAIAATLLVLDLSAQTFGAIHSDAELWAAIGGLYQNFIAFAVSFALLSLLWLIHFQQFRELERADTVLLWLNNARLMFIVLIPFTTSLIAEYSAYYAGRMLLPINFFFAALFGWLSWAWAASKGGHLLRPQAQSIAVEENRAAIGAVICGAATVALAPWIGSWAFCTYFFNAPLTALLQRARRRRGAGAPPPPAGA
jgi:uncharacterized membrane protein